MDNRLKVNNGTTFVTKKYFFSSFCNIIFQKRKKNTSHTLNKISYRNMKIKSLHQDNHTKLRWHSKTSERTLEKTILYYHLNTYTEYFIDGILQHCKHTVRLNV